MASAWFACHSKSARQDRKTLKPAYTTTQKAKKPTTNLKKPKPEHFPQDGAAQAGLGNGASSWAPPKAAPQVEHQVAVLLLVPIGAFGAGESQRKEQSHVCQNLGECMRPFRGHWKPR